MSEDLHMQIMKLLLARKPHLLVNDMAANAEACLALADNLGSLLAAVKVKRGQAYYQRACEAVLRRVDQVANDVEGLAHRMAEAEPQSTH